MSREKLLREAPFALRVVQRKEGKAAIVYRRRADAQGRDRLQRVAAISPLAFTASTPLLRDAVSRSQIATSDSQRKSQGAAQERPANPRELTTGPFHPLDADWGARVACFALVGAGLRDGERLMRTANHLRYADPDEAAWWLGMLTRDDNVRALRALRILTEAVQ
jgi:hypothetical protein